MAWAARSGKDRAALQTLMSVARSRQCEHATS